MATAVYPIGAVVPASARFWAKFWELPGTIQPGCVQVGSGWQPVSVTVTFGPAGHVRSWRPQIALEAKRYPTRKAALAAAKTILVRQQAR